ncbi:MAG: lipopolysaccharide biosynthesis protein, partial [Terracidiphilus sp.]
MNWRHDRENTSPVPYPQLGKLGAPGEQRQASRRRYRSILTAVLSALLGKGTSLIVNAITIPLTVRYLGSESYGLWVTISSAVTMYIVLDIGIATTLTNLISEAFASRDRDLAATYATTAFWLVSGIAALMGVAIWLVWPWIHWGSLFHVQ